MRSDTEIIKIMTEDYEMSISDVVEKLKERRVEVQKSEAIIPQDILKREKLKLEDL